MSKTLYIPGGEVALLPETPRKDGLGTFPPSVMIATRRGKLVLSAETLAGLLETIQSDPELRAFATKGSTS